MLNLMKKTLNLKNLVALIAIISSPVSHSEIYFYTDDEGYTHFTNRPSDPRARPWQGKSITTSKDISTRKRRYSPVIEAVAKKYQLDSALLHAVIRAESAYDEHAISRAGAVGLMQLMPATAERSGVENRWNAKSNIHGGAKYLRDLIHQFDNDLTLVLVAYNAGENAVIRYGYKIPPFPETQQYVKRVLRFYRNQRS